MNPLRSGKSSCVDRERLAPVPGERRREAVAVLLEVDRGEQAPQFVVEQADQLDAERDLRAAAAGVDDEL